MPYLPELAPLGLQIAGHLDLTDEWASLEISHQDPLDRLQKLLSKWLGDSETEKCPHTWDYFISIVRAVGKGKLAKMLTEEIAKRALEGNVSAYVHMCKAKWGKFGNG